MNTFCVNKKTTIKLKDMQEEKFDNFGNKTKI
ncbi:hypothetical protein Mgra_00003659 [Meloidogyne graminicola]|uniref:Uncharacterized protein n=1 Tax=Meloidogyne graminicola TaxID=189291 RepID=A0A8S9ZUI5_9BILA|nr:hypothetical protein Mgra_00003659 [Meloidogyne graminicola]